MMPAAMMMIQAGIYFINVEQCGARSCMTHPFVHLHTAHRETAQKHKLSHFTHIIETIIRHIDTSSPPHLSSITSHKLENKTSSSGGARLIESAFLFARRVHSPFFNCATSRRPQLPLSPLSRLRLPFLKRARVCIYTSGDKYVRKGERARVQVFFLRRQRIQCCCTDSRTIESVYTCMCMCMYTRETKIRALSEIISLLFVRRARRRPNGIIHRTGYFSQGSLYISYTASLSEAN